MEIYLTCRYRRRNRKYFAIFDFGCYCKIFSFKFPISHICRQLCRLSDYWIINRIFWEVATFWYKFTSIINNRVLWRLHHIFRFCSRKYRAFTVAQLYDSRFIHYRECSAWFGCCLDRNDNDEIRKREKLRTKSWELNTNSWFTDLQIYDWLEYSAAVVL